MESTKDKKGGGILKENINAVLDFLSPTWHDIYIYLIGQGMWFLFYLKGSLSLSEFIISIPIFYFLVRLAVFINNKFIFSQTPAGRESIKREKKIFKFR